LMSVNLTLLEECVRYGTRYHMMLKSVPHQIIG